MNPDEVMNAQTEDEAKQYAIDWQQWFSEVDMSLNDAIEWLNIFTSLADKFGLTEEFQENGII